MIDVALIGCGFIGSRHAQAIEANAGLRLVAVSDRDAAAAAAVAEASATAEVVDAYEDAIDEAAAVVVATPEVAHAEQAAATLARDRHLILEKPLTVETARAWDLVDDAAKRDVIAGTSFVLRYEDAHRELYDAVSSGRFGEQIALRALRAITRSESERVGPRGHPLYYMSIHDIDAVRWLAQAEVVSVVALERRGELASADVPDAMHALLEFDDGTIATVTGHGVLPDAASSAIVAQLELVGSDGVATLETPGGISEQITDSGMRHPDLRHWPTIGGELRGAVRAQMDAFRRAIATGTPMTATLEDGAVAQTIADAIRRSAADGTPESVSQPGR
ncbi:MAG: Gfo/Idh/MocA family oxidoreductase [Haloferacaceae archaeon]|jgi:predicted dehydrogenase|nr:Gfo/Idh/MocA family oxidoreductase [Haloferacaceae archaeon]